MLRHGPSCLASGAAELAGGSAVEDGGVTVSLAAHARPERELVTQIVRRMLDAGLAIDRVTSVEPSLEERFLNITQRLEDAR